MRTLLAVFSACLLVMSCGSRSANFLQGRDGDPEDGGGTTRRDGWTTRDATIQREIAPLDSCLPVPSEQVQGRYRGQWEGTVDCFGGFQPEYIEGDMTFYLEPAGGPEAFTVQGSMMGQMLDVFKFSSTIAGTMSCTSLEANLPDITVQGSGMMSTFLGSLSGVFTAQGFEGGSWQAKGGEGETSCIALGTWKAAHYW